MEGKIILSSMPLEELVEAICEKLSLRPQQSEGKAPPEIINREELCRRLDISEPTARLWEKKGRIPVIRLGSNIRYNWPSVVESLENKKSR